MRISALIAVLEDVLDTYGDLTTYPFESSDSVSHVIVTAAYGEAFDRELYIAGDGPVRENPIIDRSF